MGQVIQLFKKSKKSLNISKHCQSSEISVLNKRIDDLVDILDECTWGVDDDVIDQINAELDIITERIEQLEENV